MRTVHADALKAAAKVAFSVALLDGCAGATKGVSGTPDPGGSEAVTSTNGSDKKHDAGNADASDGQPLSCDAVLAETFPAPDKYQWQGVPQSAEVVSCCDAELTAKGDASRYRFECCVAYDPAVSDGGADGVLAQKHGSACTPWGPPVPPAMKRRVALPDQVA
jgi:hypothetical protein